jgi:hypothetical protein
MIQFPEHENGQQSSDPKVSKLDKLARLMNVLVHIDGVPYGKLSDENKAKQKESVTKNVKKVVSEEPKKIEEPETIIETVNTTEETTVEEPKTVATVEETSKPVTKAETKPAKKKPTPKAKKD